MIAPTSSAAVAVRNITNEILPATRRPMPTAGLRIAPEYAETSTPAKTARPHPQLTIRKPPPKPLFFASATLATTPQPSRISIAVPTSSERK